VTLIFAFSDNVRRYKEDAHRIASAAFAADPSNGNEANKVGTALLGMGRWVEPDGWCSPRHQTYYEPSLLE